MAAGGAVFIINDKVRLVGIERAGFVAIFPAVPDINDRFDLITVIKFLIIPGTVVTAISTEGLCLFYDLGMGVFQGFHEWQQFRGVIDGRLKFRVSPLPELA